MPRPKAMAYTVNTCTWWVLTRIPSKSARRPAEVWVKYKMWRFSRRSATRPPYGPRINMGTYCSATAIPRSTDDPVICNTNQPWASDCIHVPDTEISWPMEYRRKLRTLRAANVREASRSLLLTRPPAALRETTPTLRPYADRRAKEREVCVLRTRSFAGESRCVLFDPAAPDERACSADPRGRRRCE